MEDLGWIKEIGKSAGLSSLITIGAFLWLRSDIAQVKIEVAQVKTELKTEIAQVKTELKTEIAQVKIELKTEINRLNKRIDEHIQYVRHTAVIPMKETLVEGE